MATFRGVRRIAGPYDPVGSYAPGECPHRLRTWRTITLPSGREHYVPNDRPCEADHVEATQHVTASGERWT